MPLPESIHFRPAAQPEIAPALRILVGTFRRPADDEQVRDFLQFALSRGIQIANLRIAEDGKDILFAILPVPSPGRTMLFFSSTDIPTPRHELAGRGLIDHVAAEFKSRNTDLAQVLLDPAQQTAQRLYTASGFSRMAELLYLQAVIRRSTPAPKLPPAFSLQTYSTQAHPIFAATILSTYENSLDCPALNGLRDIEAIIAGHRATGEFDPRLWFLLLENQTPRGILLLNSLSRNDTLELVYLGLTPQSRGRHLSDLLMHHALHTAAQQRFTRLSLAVDANNPPALQLYYRHGLQRITSKIALIRDLRTTSPTSP